MLLLANIENLKWPIIVSTSTRLDSSMVILFNIHTAILNAIPSILKDEHGLFVSSNPVPRTSASS